MKPELIPEDFPEAHGWRSLADALYPIGGPSALDALVEFMDQHGNQEKNYSVYVYATGPILQAARRRSTRNKVTPNFSG